MMRGDDEPGYNGLLPARHTAGNSRETLPGPRKPSTTAFYVAFPGRPAESNDWHVAACVVMSVDVGGADLGAGYGSDVRSRRPDGRRRVWAGEIGDRGLCERRTESVGHVGSEAGRAARRTGRFSSHQHAASRSSAVRTPAARRAGFGPMHARAEHVARGPRPRLGRLPGADGPLSSAALVESCAKRDGLPDARCDRAASAAGQPICLRLASSQWTGAGSDDRVAGSARRPPRTRL